MFNGYYYKGGWTNDIKNGQGEETDEEGNMSVTTWVNGLKDGEGTYIKKGSILEKVIFHEGIVCHPPISSNMNL